jgi:hypothetical protein
MFDVNYVFKYNSLSEHDVNNLRNSKLFLRTATKFNDVFDSTPYYSEEIFLKMLKNHVDEFGMNIPGMKNFTDLSYQDQFEKFKLYFRNNYDSTLKDSGLITCFSKASNNNIMWARYAKEYEGAIFVYDKDKLKESAIDNLLGLKRKGLFDIPDNVLIRGVCLEAVQYTDFRADISNELEETLNFISKYGHINDLSDPKYKEAHITDQEFSGATHKMFFYKTKEWEYEKEVRLVMHNYFPEKAIPHTDKGKTLLLNIKPEAVILGFKTPQTIVKKVINICKEQNISMYGSGPYYFDRKCVIKVEPLKNQFINEMLK